MSKQSEAKKAQGYIVSPACCKTCACFSSINVPLNRWAGDNYVTEKNKRCELGGFAVQSTGHCRMFVRGSV